MISFLQNILQKHHKWLFGVLLFVVIIAFVFTIGAAPGIGRAKIKPHYFYNHNLANAAEMQKIAENVTYSGILERADINLIGKHLDFFVIRRIIALGLADEFQVPNPTTETLKQYIKTLPICLDDKGRFSADLYASLLEMFKRNTIGQDRLTEVLCEDYKIKEIESIIAGNGLVFDEQVISFLTKSQIEHNFTVATITPNDMIIDENISDTEMEKFYNDHPHQYTQPQMYAVSIIKFKSNDFVKTVPIPNEETLMTFFLENEGYFEKDSNFHDIKDRVFDAYIKAESTKIAYSKAEDFVNELYQNGVTLNSQAFKDILAKFAIEKEKIVPYSKKKLPNVNGIASTYLLEVCDLEGDRYYTDPCPATFGCVVLLLEHRKGAKELSLAEAKQAIGEDIIRERKLSKFTDKVENIRREVVDSLATDKNLPKIFTKHDLEFDTFEGISIGNMEEKQIDHLYMEALMSLKRSEHIKLMPIDDDKVLMFVVVDRKFPTNDIFSQAKRTEAASILKFLSKNFILTNFFDNQAARIK
ncbi:MAG: peptidyl-prolyl cis-trans isomerase [Puniceicoccales bacterium]|jgi:peptidyl-prolyl cis-trans isomerase D|nr:peptidyl-prolyl cis-trans isomerase [Puniceicoccales bacterium]